MQKKLCQKCGEYKPISAFHKRSDSKDGYQYKCKQCAIHISKEHYKNNGKETKQTAVFAKLRQTECVKIVNDIKTRYGCCFCNEKETCCLDFHHQDPSKKEGPVSTLAKKKSIIKAINELNKCIVVCSNCHRKIHSKLLDCRDKQLCNEDLEHYKKQYYLIRYRNPNPGMVKCECGRYKGRDSKTCHECAKKNGSYSHDKVYIDRDTLKKLIWEKPIEHIGKDYGISGSAVIKKCKKYGIERPGRGYWQRTPINE